jgi:MerR family mercuric resistance operon transcriptional regulator
LELKQFVFYERQELISAPPRTAAGYRQYPKNTIPRLRFIRRAKELGFSLKEIKELLILHGDPQSTCSDIRQLSEKKRDDINGGSKVIGVRVKLFQH